MCFSGLLPYFIAALFLLLLVLFLPLTLRIKLHNLRDDSNTFITLKVWLFRYIPLFALQRTAGGEEKVISGLLLTLLSRTVNRLITDKGFADNPVYLLHLGAAFNWRELTVLLRTGTGDPALTGIIVGFLRTLSSVLITGIKQGGCFARADTHIRVYPSFWKQEFTYFATAEGNIKLGLLVYYILFSRPIKQEVTGRWPNSIPSRP